MEYICKHHIHLQLNNMRIIRYVLFPFSCIYWCITYIRNVMFDKGIISQSAFPIPIISFGNITVGGTGKTPHTQYLISKLQHTHSVATLSRGYKRKTKGYVDTTQTEITPQIIGDEAFMTHKNFPNCIVAVCEKRVVGVQSILTKHPHINCIILDDAFQHRHILPGYQILLVDYTRPIWNDFVFPTGNLREGTYAVARAHAVIVTKCPFITDDIKKMWRKKLRLQAHQKLFFSSISYGKPYAMFSKKHVDSLSKLLENKHVILITGLARADSLYQYIQTYTAHLVHFEYPDHYEYTTTDIADIVNATKNISEYVIVTTEKDMHKLHFAGLPDTVNGYVIPIEPTFDDESAFLQEITNYLSQNSLKNQ